jgi:N-methylhydantoinase A/oxoprolinase/acetone carboxylase beta subunit
VLGGLFEEMITAAQRQLEAEGFAPAHQRLMRSVDVRYRGQAFELNVAVGDPQEVDALEAEFHAQHRLTYGHANPQTPVELVNARLVAYGVVARPAAERHGHGAGAEAPALRRAVWFGGTAHECPAWDRERLASGALLRGPAIVEEFGATTVIPPGWGGIVDTQGNLRLAREARP